MATPSTKSTLILASPPLQDLPVRGVSGLLHGEMLSGMGSDRIDGHLIALVEVGVVFAEGAHDLGVAPPQGSMALTFFRTRSFRHTRHRGSR